MIPLRRCGWVQTLVALSIVWNAASLHAQVLAKPKGNSLLLIGDFNDPTSFRAAVPMVTDDGSTAGVCTVDVASDYDFNHYQPAPKPSRIDIEITVKNPIAPGLWLPGLTSAPTGPLIYTIAGSVEDNYAVEVVSFTSDNPAEIPHTVNEFEDEIVQIAAQPSDRFVWVHTVNSDDPTMFRLASYSIDPANPVMDQTSQVFSAEMEGSLVPGTLTTSENGKAFAIILGSPSIPDVSPGLLAAGFQGDPTVTALSNVYLDDEIFLGVSHLNAPSTNDIYTCIYGGSSQQRKQEGGTGWLTGYQFSGEVGTPNFIGSAQVNNPGEGVVVVGLEDGLNARAFAPHDGNSVAVFDYEAIGSGGTIETVSLQDVAGIFPGGKSPGAINNITLSSDGHTIGLTTQSNPSSGDPPAFFHFDANTPTQVNRNADGTMVFYYDLINTGAAPLLNGEPVNQYGLSLTNNTALVVGDNSTHPTEPPRMLAIGYNTPEGFLDPTLVSFKLTGLEETPEDTRSPTPSDTPVAQTNTPSPTGTPGIEGTNTPTDTETPLPEETDTPTNTETPLPEETETPTTPDGELPDLNVSVAIDLSVNAGEGDGEDYVAVFLTDGQEMQSGVCIVTVTDTFNYEWYVQAPPFVNDVRVPNDFITDIPLTVTEINPDRTGMTWYAPPDIPDPSVYAWGNIPGEVPPARIETIPYDSNDPSQLSSNYETWFTPLPENTSDWNDADSFFVAGASVKDETTVQFRVLGFEDTGADIQLSEIQVYDYTVLGAPKVLDIVGADGSDFFAATVQSADPTGQSVETTLLLARATQPVSGTLMIPDAGVGNLNLDADSFGNDKIDVAVTYFGLEKQGGLGTPTFHYSEFDTQAAGFTKAVSFTLSANPIPGGLLVVGNDEDDTSRRKAFVALEGGDVTIYDISTGNQATLNVNNFASSFGLSTGEIAAIAKSPDGNSVGIVAHSDSQSGDPPTYVFLRVDDPSGFNPSDTGPTQYYALEDSNGDFLLNGSGEPLDESGLVITNNTAFVLSDNTIASNDPPNVAVIGFDTPQDFTGNTIVTIDLGKNEEAFPNETPTPCPTPPAETPTPTETPTIPIADHPEFDVDGSGKIDANDLMIFMKDWMKCVPGNGR